jgi:hypothetical protein
MTFHAPQRRQNGRRGPRGACAFAWMGWSRVKPTRARAEEPATSETACQVWHIDSTDQADFVPHGRGLGGVGGLSVEAVRWQPPGNGPATGGRKSVAIVSGRGGRVDRVALNADHRLTAPCRSP